jgi:RNA-directed DNA polymerase
MTTTPEPKDKLDATTTRTAGAAQAAAAVVGVVNGPEDEILEWDAVGWRAAGEPVRRLRQRIFTASQAGFGTPGSPASGAADGCLSRS